MANKEYMDKYNKKYYKKNKDKLLAERKRKYAENEDGYRDRLNKTTRKRYKEMSKIYKQFKEKENAKEKRKR